MTIVVGKIEPLKKLKTLLNDAGITRFNSIGEINAFSKNYELEREEIPKVTKMIIDEEIKDLEHATKVALERSKKNFVYKMVCYLKIKSLIHKKSKIENNYEKVLLARCNESYKTLDFTKEVVDSLYTIIAGAIGENLTVKEIEKLPSNYYLINDYSVKLDPPIYNKKENDKIFSIQIDHLLISKSGVFILETKNWSNKAIKSLDLRSPVKQISRISYALFVLLNSKSNVKLANHHWGSKKIPIRSIIVMTKFKPKEEFKNVKVLTVNELNDYIKYFDETFNEQEVKSIFNHLKNEAI